MVESKASASDANASTTDTSEETSSDTKAPRAIDSSEPPVQAQILKRPDLGNLQQLLIQRNRAIAPQKKLALSLLEDGTRLAEQGKQQGLNNQRSGLSKVFCSSAMEYPTVEALIGCAESIALANVSFDRRLQSFGEASAIYRIIPAFGNAIQEPLSIQKQENIDAKIACLDAFVWQPDLEQPGCQLVREALKNN
ncbi:MAG: hypothetical protein AAGC93_05650 [Cyanobacteria bacterium P01_F01_bin.53]